MLAELPLPASHAAVAADSAHDLRGDPRGVRLADQIELAFHYECLAIHRDSVKAGGKLCCGMRILDKLCDVVLVDKPRRISGKSPYCVQPRVCCWGVIVAESMHEQWWNVSRRQRRPRAACTGKARTRCQRGGHARESSGSHMWGAARRAGEQHSPHLRDHQV